MKNPYPRVFPIWLIPLLVLIAFSLMQCGCRTGGTRLNPNSAGTVIIPQTPQEINERNNEAIELPPFEPLAPIPIVPPARKHTNAARSNPVIPEPQSAKANPVASNPKASGASTSFSPTVSTNLLTKLPPAKAKKLPPKIIEGDGGCVVITDNPKNPQTNNKAATETNGFLLCDPMEKPKEKQAGTNWLSLFTFYITCFLGLIILWVIYDIIKDAIEMKKQGSPMKKHLENLKKPAKGTRAARKPTKKKPTKKKSTKKKPK
jgi:hypothetical protein